MATSSSRLCLLSGVKKTSIHSENPSIRLRQRFQEQGEQISQIQIENQRISDRIQMLDKTIEEINTDSQKLIRLVQKTEKSTHVSAITKIAAAILTIGSFVVFIKKMNCF